MPTSGSDWVTTARERTVAAIREGRIQDALAGVDAIWAEGRPIHDFYGDMCATFCDFIAAAFKRAHKADSKANEIVFRAWSSARDRRPSSLRTKAGSGCRFARRRSTPSHRL
jgi:hypothetical protein